MACPDKTRHASKAAARRSAGGMGNRVRAYLCPACHGWHVTHGEGKNVDRDAFGRAQRRGKGREAKYDRDHLSTRVTRPMALRLETEGIR